MIEFIKPNYIFGKTIDFERDTRIGGHQFPDEQQHIAADVLMLRQTVLSIDPEGAEIGQITGKSGTARVMLTAFFFLVFDIIFQNVDLLKNLCFFRGQKADAALVDQKGFFDEAVAGFLHGGIIHERFVDQITDRQTCQGLVPVADFHGMQRGTLTVFWTSH